jgi:hypothetical protein
MFCLTVSPDRLVGDHVPHIRLDIEENSLQDLLGDRLARSRAILAISLTAASVNIKSAPWNRTSI